MQSIREKLAGKKSKLALPQEKVEDHPADLTGQQDGAFYNVDIDQISPDPNQPRKFFDPEALRELADSIRQKGVLQPVIIRKDAATNRIYLVAGERRFRASQMAGLTRIPAILTKGNPMEIALIENLQRENLKPLEEAEALRQMVEKHNYTYEQLGLVLGKAKSTIAEIMSLNRLPELLKTDVRHAEQYPRRLLVEVAKQKTPQEMMALINQVKSGQLKSNQVREIARANVRAKNRTPGTIAYEKIHNLNQYLKKFNLGTADESQKIQLVSELKQLSALIDRLLS
ncbi:MAG: ParB/RepB/Spo0J family partition protein [Syntrophobacteraceae bacterium]